MRIPAAVDHEADPAAAVSIAEAELVVGDRLQSGHAVERRAVSNRDRNPPRKTGSVGHRGESGTAKRAGHRALAGPDGTA